ncbi:3-oxoacyl-[acyl-carrier-protein] synthase I, chloroplastic [Tanacetum coccineum]
MERSDLGLDDCQRYCIVAGKKALEDACLGIDELYKIDKVASVPSYGSGIGGALWQHPIFASILAANHIRQGEADLMIAGGVEASVIPIGLGGFTACRALSQRNDDPEMASRPWDKDRDGFVIGEGAGVLVMESLEHAIKRDAPIIAEYLGGAINCDAYHITDPRPDGLGLSFCIQRSLMNAGVSAEEVNYINAHATSSVAGDLAELEVLKQCDINGYSDRMAASTINQFMVKNSVPKMNSLGHSGSRGCMLPQIRELVREKNTALVASGGNPSSSHFSYLALSASNNRNPIRSRRLVCIEFEGDAVAWWKAYSRHKGGDAWSYLDWAAFQRAVLSSRFLRLIVFLDTAAGNAEEQSKELSLRMMHSKTWKSFVTGDDYDRAAVVDTQEEEYVLRECRRAAGTCFKCGQAGHLQRDCKKNFGASSSGHADKKPDASGRVFALTSGSGSNILVPSLVHLVVKTTDVTIDCHSRRVIFGDIHAPEFIYHGSLPGKPMKIISALKARTLLSHGCEGFLATIHDTTSDISSILESATVADVKRAGHFQITAFRTREMFVWVEERGKELEELKQRLVSLRLLTLPFGSGGISDLQ